MGMTHDVMAAANQEGAWSLLKSKADSCQACPLGATATQKVFSRPAEYAGHRDVVFIGEAPGEEEDQTGIPFVGRSGKLLTEHIERVGLQPSAYYIVNCLQCRPPGNATPGDHHLLMCTPFLADKINLIQPKVLVAIGGTAAKHVLAKEISVLKVAGTVQGSWLAGAPGGRRITLPTFVLPHPSWALRSNDNRLRFSNDVDKMASWLVRICGIVLEQPRPQEVTS